MNPTHANTLRYARSAKNGLPIDLIRIPVVYTR